MKTKKEFNLEAWENDLKQNKLKKKMRKQRNTTQMKEKTKNTRDKTPNK